MRTVYAMQFRLAHDDLAPPRVFERAGVMACDWVAEWYSRRGVVPEGPAVWQLRHSPLPGHEIELAVRQAGADCQLSLLEWSRPAADDPRARWQAAVTLARCGDQVEVAVVIRLGSSEFVVSPFRYLLRRPTLVARLTARGFRATLNGRKLSPLAVRLGPDDIPDFVAHDLLSPQRLLPIVLLSQEPATGLPLCDPNELADALVGIAEVFLLNGIDTTFELTDQVAVARCAGARAAQAERPSSTRRCGSRSRRSRDRAPYPAALNCATRRSGSRKGSQSSRAAR
ncbi:MAG: hypothetical protein AB7Y46_08200 [Armatimonadota bacterium]